MAAVEGQDITFGAEVPAEELDKCTTPPDNFFGNAQRLFDTLVWIRRGLCVRHGGNDPKCYSALNQLLNNELNEVRKGEYAGAAGVMALLPTIGALLGAPTNEIWLLMTMVPFGGALAMFMSFGGAILPMNTKDYESEFMKENIDNRAQPHAPNRTNSDTSFFKGPNGQPQWIIDRADKLMAKVDKALRPGKSKKINVLYMWFGLIGMLVLLLGAQAAMGIVEQGAILPWWCASRWWIHMWYGMG